MNGGKILALPEQLSKERVVVVIYHPQENIHGQKMGRFVLQMKDNTYYPEFRQKFTFFGTQIHEGETPKTALARRLAKEVPKIADEIVEKMRQWKGLHLPWEVRPETYYCHVFVMIVGFKELEELRYAALGQGTKQGILYVKTRPDVERMYRINHDFMAGLSIVAEEFLAEFDAGRIKQNE